jgi:hypothetical protein
MKTEKVYITRDELSDKIWVWRKPKKGNWSPHKQEDCDVVNWVRPQSMDELDTYQCYLATEFKEKFGQTIRAKTKKCVHLDVKLLNDGKLIVR